MKHILIMQNILQVQKGEHNLVNNSVRVFDAKC